MNVTEAYKYMKEDPIKEEPIKDENDGDPYNNKKDIKIEEFYKTRELEKEDFHKDEILDIENKYQNKIYDIENSHRNKLYDIIYDIKTDYESDKKELIHKYNIKLNNSESKLKEYYGILDTTKISDSNKRWLITGIITILVVLLMSTYTVNIVDKLLDRCEVDLFSQTNKMNELLFLIIQVILVIIVVRLILQIML